MSGPPVNRHRGEVGALIDGRPHTLCLTLGALAELEDAFGLDDLGALAARFGEGRVSSRDILNVVRAGLRGGGHAVDDETISRMRFEGGATGMARLCGELIDATFGPARGGGGA